MHVHLFCNLYYKVFVSIEEIVHHIHETNWSLFLLTTPSVSLAHCEVIYQNVTNKKKHDVLASSSLLIGTGVYLKKEVSERSFRP